MNSLYVSFMICFAFHLLHDLSLSLSMFIVIMLLHQPYFFNKSINISIILSVAREPDLQDWIARTRVYDVLLEPVSQKDILDLNWYLHFCSI